MLPSKPAHRDERKQQGAHKEKRLEIRGDKPRPTKTAGREGVCVLDIGGVMDVKRWRLISRAAKRDDGEDDDNDDGNG